MNEEERIQRAVDDVLGDRDAASRGLAERAADAKRAHAAAGPRAGVRAWCAGNKWAEENAKAVGNW